MDIISELHDNSYAEIFQHSILQDTISRHTVSVGTPTVTADRFWVGPGSSFGTLSTEDYLTDRLGIGTRYYNRSEQPRPTVKPLDEVKLDLLDNIRRVKNKRELYMLLSKSMRELQFLTLKEK